MTIEDLLATWRADNVINLELLGLCGDDDFELITRKSLRSQAT